MNFDLLSLNLLLVICGVVTTTIVFLVRIILWPMYYPPQLHKKRGRPKKSETVEQPPSVVSPHRVLKKQSAFWLVFIAVFTACTLRLLIAHYADSSIPGGFVFMLLPATVSIGLAGFSFKLGVRIWSMAIGCMAFSILFSLLLINNYYRFYPTLGEVFNQNGVAALSKDSDILVSHTAPTHGTSSANRQSVEGTLNAVANEQTKGKVYSLNIPGTVSGFHARTAYVYLPAIYSTDPSIRLPVVVLTPGFPGLPENWLGSGLETTMDDFAQAHNGITPIIFMVDNTGSVTNDTECVNSPRGNVETYLSVDVPNYIKHHFNVETGSSHWAIGGLSLGGTCGIMLALRHPDVYDNFIDLGGEIGPEVGPEQQTINTLFGGSVSDWRAHQPEYLLSTHTYKGMGGFFGDGKQDTPDITQAAEELNSDAQKAGIQTVYEIINGQHTFNVWQQTFKIALPWISNRLGATECRGECV